MKKVTVCLDYTVATDLMDCIFTLYMSTVESMGGNLEDPNIRSEGVEYAKKKFIELTKEFENTLPMQFAWVEDDEEE